MKHPNEPSIEELKVIQKELFTSESTDENVKKLRAIEFQIARREKEEKNPWQLLESVIRYNCFNNQERTISDQRLKQYQELKKEFESQQAAENNDE